MLEEILDKLKNSTDSELLDYSKLGDANFEDEEIYHNNGDSLDSLFSGNIDEAVRATSYGTYDYTHSFLRLDAYSNLESTNDIREWIDVEGLAEYILDNSLTEHLDF